jgi:Protein of unknown function (DUF1343)
VLLRKNCNLIALYTPEHGLDGREKAGRYIRSRRDPVTGLTAHSLYGPTRKPTPAMLRGIDTMVFDLQDIGRRGYTYISTIAKCVEAAAENQLEFVLLDRPNPLGDTDLRWIPTSPNIPRWNSPLYYVATGLIGELDGPETGVGGAMPFEILSARGVSASVFTDYVNSQHLTGVSFSEYRSGAVGGSYLRIDPAAPEDLTAINVYALAEMNRQLRTNLIARRKRGKREMSFKCYDSSSIASQFTRGNRPAASWTADVMRFKAERSQYLLY